MGQIIEVKVEQLVPADWNYKKDDEEKATKLKASIEHDGSAGVPAVRQIADGKYEVIDGNHRLKAIQEIGWEAIKVEDFGKISKARAVTIAHRRNTLWFESDILALSDLLKNDVLKEFSLEELEKIMPEKAKDLEALLNLTDFDWNKFSGSGGGSGEEWEELKFNVAHAQKEVIMRAINTVIAQEKYENNPEGMALEMLAAEYLSGARLE